MTAPFDPIALGLVRELVEADEAWHVTGNVEGIEILSDEYDWTPEYIQHRREYWQRSDDYENLTEALLSHLLIIPCPAIDTSAYERLWAHSLTLPEDERENGKLWDAVEDIARQAIEIYRGMK